MMRYLALDWGKKAIGVAFGTKDSAGSPCISPIKDIKTKDLETAFFEIARLVKEIGADQIVMGNPLNMQGLDTPMSLEIKRISRSLQKRTGLPVVLTNEYLSTQDAKKIAEASGDGGHSRAATIILSKYFETKLQK